MLSEIDSIPFLLLTNWLDTREIGVRFSGKSLEILWEYSGNAHTGVEVPEWSDSIFVQYVEYLATSLRQYWYHYASIYHEWARH